MAMLSNGERVSGEDGDMAAGGEISHDMGRMP
jgi:hypothetical protein